jgi:hypothetical protein
MVWRDFTRDRIPWLHIHLTRILLMIFSLELQPLFTGRILSRIRSRVLLFLRKLSLGPDLKRSERDEM